MHCSDLMPSGPAPSPPRLACPRRSPAGDILLARATYCSTYSRMDSDRYGLSGRLTRAARSMMAARKPSYDSTGAVVLMAEGSSLA